MVESGLCKADCYLCVNFCPQKVFTKEQGACRVLFPDKCIAGCSSCQKVCRENAISFPAAPGIRIDGVELGLSGFDEAMRAEAPEQAFEMLDKHNYLPPAIREKVKQAVAEEFKRRRGN